MKVSDSRGRLLSLGPALNQGGEGSVHAHPEQPSSLIKIYANTTNERAEKILALLDYARQADPGLLKHAAWPTDAIYGSQRKVVGFVMPKIKGRPIHSFYSPKERKQTFPHMSWRQLIKISENTAIAFEGLHQSGVVLGDINEGNFLVTDEGFVKLIDCDSYQITQGGRTFKCPVGVGMWTPPELQGQSFADIVRTADHDAFGLAVLIFQLLFIGRHPFAAKRREDHSIEQAIQQNLFAYSREIVDTGAVAPDLSLSVHSVGQSVFRLFEQAFLANSPYGESLVVCPSCSTTNRLKRSSPTTSLFRCGSCKVSLPNGSHHQRPSASAWIEALRDLDGNLITCPNNKTHQHLRGQRCPFCDLETRGYFAFSPAFDGAHVPTAELGPDPAVRRLWEELRTAAIPAYNLPILSPVRTIGRPLPRGITRSNPRFYQGWALVVAAVIGSYWIGGFAALAIFIGVTMILSGKETRAYRKEMALREEALSSFRRQCANLETELITERTRLGSVLDKIRREAAQIFQEIEQLQLVYRNGIKELDQKRRDVQLRAHLNKYLIARRKFSGLGPIRKALLQANGIETAADIYFARYRVRGIPSEVWDALRKWSERQCQQFIFDESEPIPPEEIANLGSSLRSKKSALVAALQKLRSDWLIALQRGNQLAATISRKSLVAQQQAIQAEQDIFAIREV